MNYKILVPLDGSDLADRALPWADAWAGALDAEVELLHVTSAPAFAPVSSDDVYDYFDERDTLKAQEALEAATHRFTQARHIGTRLVNGLPSDTIVLQAEERGASLIIMGTHGRGGLTRTLMGSVASSVIRRSRVPVLPIRSDLLMPAGAPKKVLVPVDGSDLAAGVIPYLVPIARDLRLSVSLYWVAPEGGPDYAATAGRVEALAERLEVDHIHVQVEIEHERDPAAAIASFAAREGFGLIAMSTHGYNGIGRWRLGSVTDWVIRHATVPVMAIRPKEVPLRDWATLKFAEVPTLAERTPAINVTLSSEQARLTRLALENLAWSATRHDGVAQQVRETLRALDAAMEGAA